MASHTYTACQHSISGTLTECATTPSYRLKEIRLCYSTLQKCSHFRYHSTSVKLALSQVSPEGLNRSPHTRELFWLPWKLVKVCADAAMRVGVEVCTSVDAAVHGSQW